MISVYKSKPSIRDYREIRKAVNWNCDEINDERIKRSLDNSPLCFCAYDLGKLVGMIRIAGDLEMYGYIQDTIVIPSHQGHQVGTMLMIKVLDEIRYKKGYLLGVCPSKVAVEFYSKFGFIKRPENPNGFMYMEIK